MSMKHICNITMREEGVKYSVRSVMTSQENTFGIKQNKIRMSKVLKSSNLK